MLDLFFLFGLSLKYRCTASGEAKKSIFAAPKKGIGYGAIICIINIILGFKKNK